MRHRPHTRAATFRVCLLAVAGWWICLCAGSLRAAPAPVYTLAQCLDLAARQNPEVLIAAKQVDAARALVTQAKGPKYPALVASGYYQRREQSLATSGGVLGTGIRKDDYTGDLRLTQNIFSSFGVRSRIEAAQLSERIAKLNYQAALNTAGSQIREAFYSTLAAEASIAVRQQAIDLLSTQLKDQQDRLAAGSVGQVNVNRAQVALANEQPELLDARANIRTAYAALAQLLAIPYPNGATEAPFHVRGELEVRPFKLPLEECIQQAVANRPEIEARKLALDVLARQIVAEKSATRPQVTAFAAYDIYSQPIIATQQENFSGYTVGLAASWAIFDGFATLGRVRGVRAQQGEAAAALVSTRLQVETEVRNAYDQLRTAEATLVPQAQNIALASETLDLTTRNLAAGLGTQIDVQQTRVDLTRARTQELGGRLSYNLALNRLNRAMAVGIPTPGLSVTSGTITRKTGDK